MRRMEPDLIRTSRLGSAATRRGFFGVRLTDFRAAGAAGFLVLGGVDAITGGGGGGGTVILGVPGLGALGLEISGGGNGVIIGGGGGATGMGMRALGTRGGADTLGLRGGVRRAVLIGFRGACGLAIFFLGAFCARCLTGLGGVSTIRGAWA